MPTKTEQVDDAFGDIARLAGEKGSKIIEKLNVSRCSGKPGQIDLGKIPPILDAIGRFMRTVN